MDIRSGTVPKTRFLTYTIVQGCNEGVATFLTIFPAYFLDAKENEVHPAGAWCGVSHLFPCCPFLVGLTRMGKIRACVHVQEIGSELRVGRCWHRSRQR